MSEFGIDTFETIIPSTARAKAAAALVKTAGIPESLQFSIDATDDRLVADAILGDSEAALRIERDAFMTRAVSEGLIGKAGIYGLLDRNAVIDYFTAVDDKSMSAAELTQEAGRIRQDAAEYAIDQFKLPDSLAYYVQSSLGKATTAAVFEGVIGALPNRDYPKARNERGALRPMPITPELRNAFFEGLQEEAIRNCRTNEEKQRLADLLTDWGESETEIAEKALKGARRIEETLISV